MSVKNRLLRVALFIALLFLILLSVTLGRYDISPLDVVRVLLPSARAGKDTIARVIFNIRLPRITMAVLAGLALAVSGAAYQGVFQNPMASPDILGSSQGAAFGASLAILWRLDASLVMTLSFVFSLATVTLVYLLSRKLPSRRTTGLILCGIMVGSLVNAGTSLVKLVADPGDQLPAITYWLMGSLSALVWKDVLTALVPLAAGVIPLFLIRWKLDLLSMGDEEAKVLGLEVDKLRLLIILCSTLATSAVISTCGTIGWVGLVIPHLARKLGGDGNRNVIPLSLLLGSLFLLIVDDFSRCLCSSEIPLGILTSFVGAPFFIFLMFRREVGHEH